MKLNFSIFPDDFSADNPTADGRLESFADADLGGDVKTKRSTSGGLSMLLGSKTRAVVQGYSKRQGQLGISTPESETVSLVVLGKRVIVLHLLVQRLLKRVVKNVYRTDNSACERVVSTGISQQMAYLKRTAALSLSWARQYLSKDLTRVPTNDNPSDIYTKPLDREKFETFRTYIGIW